MTVLECLKKFQKRRWHPWRKKRIDRKKGNLFCIKSGNEHLVLMFVCSSDTISVVDENKKHDISMHQKLLFIFEKKHMRIFQLELSVCSRGDFLFGIVKSFFKLDRQKI